MADTGEAIKTIDPFVNLPVVESSSSTPVLPNIFQIGVGDQSLKVDRRGMWFGAFGFTEAPFSVDMAGNVTATGYLASATTTLDTIADGSTYKKVLATSVTAGKIVLSQTIGNLGDISDGGGYSKLLSTEITGGRIILSRAVGTLDDISDGGTYQKTTFSQVVGANRALNGLNSSYQIVQGFVNGQLSGVGLPFNGVRIDANGIYGSKDGGVTFYINTSGDAYFAGTIAASAIYGSYIEGTFFTSAPPGQNRVVISNNADGKERIEFYNGNTIVGKIRSQPGLFQFWGQQGSITEINGDGIVRFRNWNGGGVTIATNIIAGHNGAGDTIFSDSHFVPRGDAAYNLGSNTSRWNKIVLFPRNGTPAADDGSVFLYWNGSSARLVARVGGAWRYTTLPSTM